VAFLPSTADDKIIIGLISLASAIIGFLSRGVVEQKNTDEENSEQN
jgi:hypothetical protein